MPEDQRLTRYVHTGEVVRSVGDLRVTITIDPAVMRRARKAFDAANKASALLAVPVSMFNRPDERNVIDQLIDPSVVP